jgi:hypothetical protein
MVVISTMPDWVDLGIGRIIIAPSIPAHDADDPAEGDELELARRCGQRVLEGECHHD